MSVSYFRVFVVLIGLTLASGIAIGGEDRNAQVKTYSSTDADPYAPITSTLANPSDSKGIKEPNFRSTLKKSALKKKKKTKIAKKKARYKTTRLRFKQINVKGRKSQPRVAFRRRPLKVERSDRGLTQNFYRKIFNVEPGLQ